MASEPPQQPSTDPHAPPIAVAEWITGLPEPNSIAPLSQPLVPPELVAAFRISPLPSLRSVADVNRASEQIVSSLNCSEGVVRSKSFGEEGDSGVDNVGEDGDGDGDEDLGTKTVKRQRLVWTPQLHKRFVEVVERLGIKSAVPKMIMQMMNVEGLTRENVASHLQKYRLYLKRTNGEEGSGSRNSMPIHGGQHSHMMRSVDGFSRYDNFEFGMGQGREWN